jgi:chromosomal replication initiation ATPase DnaA
VRYLLHHLPRDVGSLNRVLDTLDRHALAEQRQVTLPLVRDVLSKKNDG